MVTESAEGVKKSAMVGSAINSNLGNWDLQEQDSSSAWELDACVGQEWPELSGSTEL